MNEVPPTAMQPMPIQQGSVVTLSVMMSVALAFIGLVMGPDNIVFGMQAFVWSFCLSLVFLPVALALPERWYRVRAGERWLHRLLGVAIFARLLDRSGWNRRVVQPLRGAPVARTTLLDLVKGSRVSMGIHGICFALHLPLAAALLATGHRWGALWIMFPGVILHLYPVLLQRSILLRLEPLLKRSPG